MVNVCGSRDDPARWKPEGFEDHLLIGELCELVGRSRDRIKQCEKAGIIPAPIRVSVGALKVRLYSPSEAAKIQLHFANAKPGRKTKED